MPLSALASDSATPARPRLRWAAALAWLALWTVAGGCAQQKWVTLRSAPRNPLVEELQLTSRNGPQPSPRTQQLLRVYNLTGDLQGDERTLLPKLQQINDHEPSAANVYALAELAYLAGKKIEAHEPGAALDLYGAAVLHAYDYLFDPRYAPWRNCYDPQFRGACELYNGALEAALRIVCKNGELVPDRTKTIHTASGTWDITCALRGGNWRPQDFQRFEFVSDYEINGLTNRYQSHGLGVPLIAVRGQNYKSEPATARYYPSDLSFPVTAFLRPLPADQRPGNQGVRHQGLLELYDPLANGDTMVGSRYVPLESDLTTPLAYFLSKVPLEDAATDGLLHPEKLLKAQPNRRPAMGMYMVQPYEPGKIPVLLVHGLWSSPMTWMQMFNDLRSEPDIRAHYQFWFYLYPTAQPFWVSAAQLRRDLAEMRQVLDPQHREPALDQMVLVGHSMGGLVAKLQTLNSGPDFWNLASHLPLEQVRAEPETREKLRETFFFQPNPGIRRVVTIATPHHGSTFSNQTTQYLLDKLIHPDFLVNAQEKLFRDNKDLLFGGSLLKINTSIDSLAPNTPIFSLMLMPRSLPWVKYHNIIGVVPAKWWLSRLIGPSDGVVAESSARVDGVASELIVNADHMQVHCHPAAVLEVRRILLEHLGELRAGAAGDGMAQRLGPPLVPLR